MRKILVVVAHPDDEIIGVGGTLYKHVRIRDSVEVLILGDGKSSRNENYKFIGEEKAKSSDETLKAMRVLGIKKFTRENLPDNRFDTFVILNIAKIVSKYVKKSKAEIVYTHHPGDLNIDHKLTAEATIIACRPIENPSVKNLITFETLSSTEMAGYRPETVFMPNYFVDISKEIKIKLKAMSCYKSELRKHPHPRSIESIELNARMWGTKVNIRYAEAFCIIRKISR